jgi:hypothetical protein
LAKFTQVSISPSLGGISARLAGRRASSPRGGIFAVTSVTKLHLQGFLDFSCGDQGRFFTAVTAAEKSCGTADGLPIGNRRYGRFEICATTMAQFRIASA